MMAADVRPQATETAPPSPAARAHAPEGALVAVCGLAAGAGTTLLSWLVASSAATADAPVLLAELPRRAGGLARLAGGATGAALTQPAPGASGARTWPAAPDGPAGLRLALARPSRDAAEPHTGELVEALEGACAGHALVVVDCGRLPEPAARALLDVATHVVWTVPADPGAGDLARTLLLESDLVPPPGDTVELVAAVATQPAAIDARGQRALGEVVAQRCDRLVLVPHVRGLAGGDRRAVKRARTHLSGSITAIAGVLAREPPP